MTADLPDRAEVDLQQHRNDHQPDQRGDRQVDVRHLGVADGMEQPGKQMAERHARNDAERDPQGQVAFEQRHAGVPRLYLLLERRRKKRSCSCRTASVPLARIKSERDAAVRKTMTRSSRAGRPPRPPNERDARGRETMTSPASCPEGRRSRG